MPSTCKSLCLQPVQASCCDLMACIWTHVQKPASVRKLTFARRSYRPSAGRFTGVSCGSGGPLPSCAADVRCFARDQFHAEVDHRRPDAHINLAKACMLIALEEEAAIEDNLLQNGRAEITWLKVLSDDIQHGSDYDQELDVEMTVINREVGTASSWGLSRLDSLAQEVKSCFMAQHTALPVLDDINDCTSSSPSSSASTPMTDRQSSHSSASSSGEDHDSRSQSNDSADAEPLLAAQQRSSDSLRPGHDLVAEAMKQYPMQTIAALNTVLFERHGYHRMHVHGNPRDAKLSSVLDNGGGTPAALAVVYMEVARRLGLPMVAQPLEGGQHCMIWPEHGQLRAGGEEFVIDAYSQGAMYSMAEVVELFDLGSCSGSEAPASLQAATKRELLAAMLAALRDSHWSRAVECHPEPGLMTNISLDIAASGAVQPMHGFDIARSLAAAERRLFLLPDSREIQLEHALLLYFASQFDEALQEMQLYGQTLQGISRQALETTLARISCLLYEKAAWQ